jgi:hypothetical protein
MGFPRPGPQIVTDLYDPTTEEGFA